MVVAQKSKVSAAWRFLSDYEDSYRDGKPEEGLLFKANEAIDLALQNESTSKQVKTHAYKLRICYHLYQAKLRIEQKNLEATVQDKQERMLTAYGNVELADFEAASAQVEQIKNLDPKYFELLQQAIVKGNSTMDGDDIKLATAIQQMKLETSNIATGKYKAKKYEDAASYFYKAGVLNTLLSGIKDSASFFNAGIAAGKTKNKAIILDYNKRIIDAGVANASNYESIYSALLEKGDTAEALNTLKKGRVLFPDNLSLLTVETNNLINAGRGLEAISALVEAFSKNSSNGFLALFIGNLYDNTANPKDKTGKELAKPTNFDDLFKNAESYYIKATELNGDNKEYLYNALYDLGAMYNNYGGYLSMKKVATGTDGMKAQKENEAKASEYFKRAIPYLEKALTIKPEDASTMKALRLLYLKTGEQAKANEMNEKIKQLK
jgi:Flp pilus assembly protein TadD